MGRGKHRAQGSEVAAGGEGAPRRVPACFSPTSRVPGLSWAEGRTRAGGVTHIQILQHRTPQMFGPRWVVQGERFVSEPGVKNKPLAHAARALTRGLVGAATAPPGAAGDTGDAFPLHRGQSRNLELQDSI